VGEARALAAHAQKIGARAFSTLAPFFFKPGNVADLVEFTAQVAGAAPEIPFYFYHLPSMTGVTLSMTEYFKRAADRIANFVGIKFTHGDVMEFQQCVALAGAEREVLFGRDEMLLAGLAAGGRGAIGSTYNYAAPVYRRLIEAFGRGDLAAAREHQAQAVQLVEVLRKYGEIPAAKAITTMMGVDLGPARTPLGKLSAEQVEAIYRELSGLDIFTRPLHR
jgi:N-acetylneuraminate lyase